jgi:hypothetical protein
MNPPPELVQQWANACPYELDTAQWVYEQFIAACAAQWGADQELEACLRYAGDNGLSLSRMRAARRPKPPSLKEQALAELEKVDMLWDTTEFSQEALNSLDTIRRALEALDD